MAAFVGGTFCSASVKLITEKFEDVNPHDDRVKNVKLALITAQCSRSGVADPVNFIVSEGEGAFAEPTYII